MKFFIDTASLKVEHVADDWFLLDRHRIYFNFGTRENEADLALAVLRHYNFTRVGYVGQGTPVMNLFLGSLSAAAPPQTIKAETTSARTGGGPSWSTVFRASPFCASARRTTPSSASTPSLG